MWKTGYESLPSFMPRSLRMTLMKWMHEERSRGRDVDLVSNCVLLVCMPNHGEVHLLEHRRGICCR